MSTFIAKVGVEVGVEVIRAKDRSLFCILGTGYIDVGDGCWRPNVLVTSLRCR